MSHSVKLRLEDLDIKPFLITKLKMAGIESVFDLAISIPHQLTDISGGMLTGTDENVALELVTKAKKALVDSGLLYKDFSTAQDILDRSVHDHYSIIFLLSVPFSGILPQVSI
jgi:hypothetical protein